MRLKSKFTKFSKNGSMKKNVSERMTYACDY